MATRSVILVSSSALAAGTFTGSVAFWSGGPGALVISAATYGATVQLQTQNINGIWVAVNTTTISADGCYEYKVPGGQVRMSCSGSSIGVTAVFVDLPYC